ncbi:hypothetical protein ScPMuIL_001551 [Solemya velum]
MESKRRKVYSYTDDEELSPVDYESDAEQSFNTRSFYGKREKKSFPHSPQRRKTVKQVLAKLSNEHQAAVSDISICSPDVINPKKIPGRTLRQRNEMLVVDKFPKDCLKKTPVDKHLAQVSTTAVSTQKNVILTVAPNSEKKFFKHKFPSRTDKYTRSVVVRKGFNLKFMPKCQSVDTRLTKQKKRRKVIYTGRIKNLDNDVSVGHAEKPCDSFIQNISEDKTTCRERIHVECDSNVTEFKHTLDILNNSNHGNEIDSACHIETPESTCLSDIEKEQFPGSADLFSTCSDASGQSTSTLDNFSDISNFSEQTNKQGKKLFPIFNSNSCPDLKSKSKSKARLTRSGKSSPVPSSRRISLNKDRKEQLILDAGQKRFGAMQCEFCGMVYTHSDPADETTHSRFHQDLLAAIKFPGWRKERVVQEFPNDGSRVIMVLPEDPRYAVKKVEEINKIMGQELGFSEVSQAFHIGQKAFLYISEDKRCEACCFAESITEGYRVIPDIQQGGLLSRKEGRHPWCCQSKPEPATVGVSRIWVHSQQRCRGIASKILDCVRQWFEYGVVIKKEQVAFSDPTPDGKIFATRYTGSSSFLVYKYK